MLFAVFVLFARKPPIPQSHCVRFEISWGSCSVSVQAKREGAGGNLRQRRRRTLALSQERQLHLAHLPYVLVHTSCLPHRLTSRNTSCPSCPSCPSLPNCSRPLCVSLLLLASEYHRFQARPVRPDLHLTSPHLPISRFARPRQRIVSAPGNVNKQNKHKDTAQLDSITAKTAHGRMAIEKQISPFFVSCVSFVLRQFHKTGRLQLQLRRTASTLQHDEV